MTVNTMHSNGSQNTGNEIPDYMVSDDDYKG